MKTIALDDLNEINKIDKSHMLSFCVDSAKHYRLATSIAEKSGHFHGEAENIIIAGMGGSAIGGELLKDWARDTVKLPIEISRTYSLPAYANEKSLVFIVSYTGETEESLSAFLDAVNSNCMIFCISSGGHLLKFADKLNLPYVRVPLDIPPRAALPYLLVPMLKSLEGMKLASGVSMDLMETVKLLERISFDYSPENPTSTNPAKTLASGIGETSPIIYGHGIYRSVAQRFKQQFNENSKIPSKWDFLPELNHNEIVGWENPGRLGKSFSAIFLRDEEEPNKIRIRIETTKKLMRHISKLFEVWSQGKSPLAKMLSTICIGDFTSVYLAILRKVDPTEVNTINLIKKKITEVGTKKKIIDELKRMTAQ